MLSLPWETTFVGGPKAFAYILVWYLLEESHIVALSNTKLLRSCERKHHFAYAPWTKVCKRTQCVNVLSTGCEKHTHLLNRKLAFFPAPWKAFYSYLSLKHKASMLLSAQLAEKRAFGRMFTHFHGDRKYGVPTPYSERTLCTKPRSSNLSKQRLYLRGKQASSFFSGDLHHARAIRPQGLAWLQAL